MEVPLLMDSPVNLSSSESLIHGVAYIHVRVSAAAESRKCVVSMGIQLLMRPLGMNLAGSDYDVGQYFAHHFLTYLCDHGMR